MLFRPVLLFFDLSGGELLLIILVVFLVFGPQKMPEIARKLGRVMNQVKKATNDLTREFREETSGFRDEIMSAQNAVKDEVNTVNQELNKTRARVVGDLSLSDKPVDKEMAKPNDEPGKVSALPESPAQSEIKG